MTALDDYWTALVDNDRRRALTAVRGSGLTPQQQLDVVCRAQARVGDAWQRGEWTIAQEHAATAIAEDVVAAVALDADVPPSRGSVVVACTDGEWHALPARVLAESLRLDGWQVRFLGASVPADQMSALVDELGPDAIAVSCSLASSLWTVRELVEVGRGSGVPVLVGGAGVGAEGRWALRLGATRWAPDPGAAAALLASDAWPRFVDAAPPLDLPDDDAQQLRRQGASLADAAVGTGSPAYPLGRERDDLRLVLRFLSAALLVDDPSLLEEFLGWLRDTLAHQQLPVRQLSAAMDRLSLPPRARRVLADARSTAGL